MFKLILIAAGGAIGATLRYLTTRLTIVMLGHSNVLTGTVFSNIAGCFLGGFGLGWFLIFTVYPPEWILFITTGILGSYTTFSTFALEAYKLMKQKVGTLILYLLLQVVVAFLAVYGGFKMATFLAGA